MDKSRINLLPLGSPLPDWSMESIFGDDVPIKADFLGQPLLILIFSLGCPGCLGRAIPYANRVVYEKGEQIKVIGIHTDFENVNFTTAQFEKAKQDFYIRFPLFKDKDYDTTFYKYGALGTPHWVLMDKNGNVEYSIFGSDPNNALLRLDLKIDEMLN